MSAFTGGVAGGGAGALLGWLGVKYGLGIANPKAQVLGAGVGGVAGLGLGAAVGAEREVEQKGLLTDDEIRAREAALHKGETPATMALPFLFDSPTSLKGKLGQAAVAGLGTTWALGGSKGARTMRGFIKNFGTSGTKIPKGTAVKSFGGPRGWGAGAAAVVVGANMVHDYAIARRMQAIRDELAQDAAKRK
jgi:hypothetical protein